MNIINKTIHFIKNGFSILRQSSHGIYEENSPEIEILKHEMFYTPSNRKTDLNNLKKDRANIAHDVRTAFNNIVLGNG